MTTVGYGDVPLTSINERLFRCFCMIIGVWIFGQFTSGILETNINDSLNVYKNLEKEEMITKLQHKYEMTGEPLK